MFKPQLSLVGAGFLALSLFVTSCGGSEKEPEPESLYVRMGGSVGIEGLADQMVANVGAETGTTNSLMLRSHQPMLTAINSQNGAAPTDPTRLTRLRNNVVDQFTDITGGPITYKGMNMLQAHTNMAVTDAEYRAWRLLLDNALTTRKIPAAEKAEFTAIIDRMKSDVVNH